MLPTEVLTGPLKTGKHMSMVREHHAFIVYAQRLYNEYVRISLRTTGGK